MPAVAPVPLSDPRFVSDPPGFYAWMRAEHGPVVPVLAAGGVPAWLVIGYRELHHVLSNPAVFARSSRRWNGWGGVPPDWPLNPVLVPLPNLLSAEGEEHRRRTKAVNDALDGADPHEVQAVTTRICDRLIDGFCTAGRADLRAEYAARLPMLVLGWMYGLDGPRAEELAAQMTAVFDATGAEALRAHEKIAAGVHALIAERRARPGPDVVSRLIADPIGHGDEDLVAELVAVLGGGDQPTGEWIGNALRLMLTDERFSASLSGARSSVRDALSEVLWEDSPSQIVAGRFPVHDVVLGHHHVRAGDLLLMGYAAANQDPVVRGHGDSTNHAHLSFAHGEHSCPYMARTLAETIAVTGIEVLLDRLPDLELAIAPDQVRWRPSPWVRGVASLPVTFTPTSPPGAF
ncbi:cytochrome P450 [Nocardiopsis sp. HNM0947]|uniref:Cytochrome P450 n=1 Tax=Nocardiopsis coralli TaxID=2772213 RepID=A0ABR9PB26_9ACTN|nr:cytochrome P450 [Nocardiopsis coralli]MBE3001045.1 cytochrome P450 [Nocardiopsis coralli]